MLACTWQALAGASWGCCQFGFVVACHIVALPLLFLQLGAPKIYVPNALPMYREDLPGRPLSKKRRAEKEAEQRKYQPAPGSMAKGEAAAAVGWANTEWGKVCRGCILPFEPRCVLPLCEE